jgi:hypothetical protein
MGDITTFFSYFHNYLIGVEKSKQGLIRTNPNLKDGISLQDLLPYCEGALAWQ